MSDIYLQTIIPKLVSWTRFPVFDYSDFAEMAPPNPQTISSATVTCTNNDGGLTVGTVTISGAQVSVKLSAGTAGNTYQIKCQANFSGGSVITLFGSLEVLADPSP